MTNDALSLPKSDNQFFPFHVIYHLSVVLLLSAVLFGCKVKPPQPPLVETIAILPFDSESNNIDAPDLMQRYVFLAMVGSAYQVRPIKETNEFLKEKGIQEGGQLRALDPVKLGKDLGVHALLFGNVESFGYTNIGVYVSRKVVLELKLVDATTGETLWENVGKMINRKIALDEENIKKNFAKGLADQLTDKLFDNPLEEESKWATRRALLTLPGYRFKGFAKDEKSPNAVKKGTQKVIKQVIESR